MAPGSRGGAPPTKRKRRYGLETRQLSIRLAGPTYRDLYDLVPSGQHSAFVDAACRAALRQLAAQRSVRVQPAPDETTS